MRAKLYLTIAPTVIAFGFYWLCSRLRAVRVARREIRNRKRWWAALEHAYEKEHEADRQVWGIGA